jgi:transcription elongation factor Elf1
MNIQTTTFAARLLCNGIDLLPCPFCGEQPAVERDARGKHVIWCENENCPASMQLNGNSLLETVKAWNTRGAATASKVQI